MIKNHRGIEACRYRRFRHLLWMGIMHSQGLRKQLTYWQ